jgi:hypothetical protein
MKDHNCPYLANSKYCTHKGSSLRRTDKGNVDCNYNNPLKCYLLQSKSKILLIKALKLIDKPFGLKEEDTPNQKKRSYNRLNLGVRQ